MDRKFLRKVEVLRIEPEPAEVEASADRVTYVITQPDPGHEAAIYVHYKPLAFGRVQVEVSLEGYPVQTFSQFVYP